MNDLYFLSGKGEYIEFINIYSEITSNAKAAELAQFSRRLLDAAVHFIYDKEGMTYPANATMLEVLDGNVISSFVSNKVIMESLHYARKLGMNAEHGIHIKKNQAKIAMDNIIFYSDVFFCRDERSRRMIGFLLVA